MAYIRHYDVLQNDKYGRYLVANKDLSGGEVILTDLPFAVGPKPGKSRGISSVNFKTIDETTIDGCSLILF